MFRRPLLAPNSIKRFPWSHLDAQMAPVNWQELVQTSSADDLNNYAVDSDGQKHCRTIPNWGETPLVVLVNGKSGGQQGTSLLAKFEKMLGRQHVFDMTAAGGPKAALAEILADTVVQQRYLRQPIRVLVAGGDGSVGWVLAVLDDLQAHDRFAVGVLPLGTGNDLSRHLGWGPGLPCDDKFDKSATLKNILLSVARGRPTPLARWRITISPLLGAGAAHSLNPSPEVASPAPHSLNPSPEVASPACAEPAVAAAESTAPAPDQAEESSRILVANNYLSFGADAAVALRFHLKREAKPHLFTSRTGNKAWYALYGGKEVFKTSDVKLADALEVLVPCTCNEVTEPTRTIAMNDLGALVFLNINSYSAGQQFWHPDTLKKRTHCCHDLGNCDAGDDLLEVVGVTGAFDMGAITAGVTKPQALGQVRSASISLKKPVAMQVDGEPWMQGPCSVHIDPFTPATLLSAVSASALSSGSKVALPG